MQPRDYQLKTVEKVKIGTTNLVVLPIRSGKSFTAVLILKKLLSNNDKALVITSNRNIVLQLESYFKDNSSFILSGKEQNLDKQIQLATFQTLRRRNIDLKMFKVCIIDEAHLYNTSPIVDKIKSEINTVIGLTGSPVNSNNTSLTGYKNWIQEISINELFKRGVLSPVEFITDSNADRTKFKITNGDYNVKEVEKVYTTKRLFDDVKDWIINSNINQEHKAILYTSSIEMSNIMYDKLKHLSNIILIHSKEKNVEEKIHTFKQMDKGILINVRQLTVGFDDNTVDMIICLSPTNSEALFTQRVFRQATYKEDKVGYYIDFVGNTERFNPYVDKWSQHKSKKTTCADLYEKGTMEYELCLEVKNIPTITCKTCNIDRPVFEYQFKPKLIDDYTIEITRICRYCKSVVVYEKELEKKKKIRNYKTKYYLLSNNDTSKYFLFVIKDKHKISKITKTPVSYQEIKSILKNIKVPIYTNTLVKLNKSNVIQNKFLDRFNDMIDDWESILKNILLYSFIELAEKYKLYKSTHKKMKDTFIYLKEKDLIKYYQQLKTYHSKSKTNLLQFYYKMISISN